MHKFFVSIIVVLLMSSLSAMADSHNHDSKLVGQWFATSTDGSLTALELQANGKFIFDFRSGETIERTYMCGTWERRGKQVDLDIQAQKSRLADGDIEQATAAEDGNFTVLKSSANTLVIRFNQSIVSFYRTSNS